MQIFCEYPHVFSLTILPLFFSIGMFSASQSLEKWTEPIFPLYVNTLFILLFLYDTFIGQSFRDQINLITLQQVARMRFVKFEPFAQNPTVNGIKREKRLENLTK